MRGYYLRKISIFVVVFALLIAIFGFLNVALIANAYGEVYQVNNKTEAIDFLSKLKNYAYYADDIYIGTTEDIDMEDHTSMSAGFGYISIWFEIEHSDDAVALCKEDETLELGDVDVIQNDTMYNIGVGKLFLSASLTEESHEKVAALESININTISEIASELTIKFVGYNTTTE